MLQPTARRSRSTVCCIYCVAVRAGVVYSDAIFIMFYLLFFIPRRVELFCTLREMEAALSMTAGTR